MPCPPSPLLCPAQKTNNYTHRKQCAHTTKALSLSPPSVPEPYQKSLHFIKSPPFEQQVLQTLHSLLFVTATSTTQAQTTTAKSLKLDAGGAPHTVPAAALRLLQRRARLPRLRGYCARRAHTRCQPVAAVTRRSGQRDFSFPPTRDPASLRGLYSSEARTPRTDLERKQLLLVKCRRCCDSSTADSRWAVRSIVA